MQSFRLNIWWQYQQIERMFRLLARQILHDPCMDEVALKCFIESNKERLNELILEEISRLSGYDSTYNYGISYREVKPLETQLRILHDAIPELRLGRTWEFAKKAEKITLPVGAEGWYAVISPDALGELFFPNLEGAEQYQASLRFINERLSMEVNTYMVERIVQCKRTSVATRLLRKQQRGDVWIVPAQFGLQRRKRTPYYVRQTMTRNEFGLGACHVGSMLITHPERISSDVDLEAACLGDDLNTTLKDDTSVIVLGIPRYFRGKYTLTLGMEFLGERSESPNGSSRTGNVTAFFPNFD